MNFKKALDLMKNDGVKVKLPSWDGYWDWCCLKKTVMMHTRDNRVLDIRETDVVCYTLDNICSDDWVVATVDNTPILGGVATFGFLKAAEYLDRGLSMRRECWFHSSNVSSKKSVSIYLKCNDEIVDIWKPTLEDFVATDWTFYRP